MCELYEVQTLVPTLRSRGGPETSRSLRGSRAGPRDSMRQGSREGTTPHFSWRLFLGSDPRRRKESRLFSLGPRMFVLRGPRNSSRTSSGASAPLDAPHTRSHSTWASSRAPGLNVLCLLPFTLIFLKHRLVPRPPGRSLSDFCAAA